MERFIGGEKMGIRKDYRTFKIQYGEIYSSKLQLECKYKSKI